MLTSSISSCIIHRIKCVAECWSRVVLLVLHQLTPADDVDDDGDDDDDNNDDYDDDDYDDYDDFCTYVSILLVSLNSTWALLNFLVLATMSVKHWPVVFLWLLDDNMINMIAWMSM